MPALVFTANNNCSLLGLPARIRSADLRAASRTLSCILGVGRLELLQGFDESHLFLGPALGQARGSATGRSAAWTLGVANRTNSTIAPAAKDQIAQGQIAQGQIAQDHTAQDHDRVMSAPFPVFASWIATRGARAVVPSS